MKKRITGFTILGLLVILGSFAIYRIQRKITQKKQI